MTYSHDAFARGDTLYASEINIGKLSLYDIKDRRNPKLMASQTTSRAFTHNAWPSTNGKYVFTTDERPGGYVDAYDISNLNNIKLLDKFRPYEREKDGVYPHNTHYINGFIVTSWYTDGLRVVDAHRPENLIEVAFYDTWEDPTRCNNGFYGCWGAFPFTGSDIIYGSDINNGLYIVKIDYKRACYLEGKVQDISGQAISNVKIEILSDQINKETSNPAGEYKTGQATNGVFKVRFLHPDYATKEVSVELKNGEITVLNVALTKKRPYDVTFNIVDKQNKPIVANLYLNNPTSSYNLTSLDSGPLVETLLAAPYELTVAAWGYDGFYDPLFNIGDALPNTINASLGASYADNFETALGWMVTSTAGMTGKWLRDIPKLVRYGDIISNAGSDSDDVGHKAFVTGNNGIQGAACDDVDNGVTQLTSPEMNLSNYSKPALNYDVWFFNAGGSSPLNDTLYIKLNNGINEVVVDKIFGKTNGWNKVRNIDVKSFVEPSANMKLIVEASDQNGNTGHIVEAGFDNFFVSELPSSIEDQDINLKGFTLTPNPASEIIVIDLIDKKNVKDIKYHIFNTFGKECASGHINFYRSQFEIGSLPSGMYVFSVDGYKSVRFIKI
ncbi:MAG: carboxypeptidase regulatory-like domain-containing protein [Saprospiraceae bacterium]|nr:carboxypeptidase regulatory-like domain-containing protein [Saprospiraceae bacterium]